jgi:integrase
MQGYRSKLKAVKRRKKTKEGGYKTYWVARGFIPVRKPDGSFARRRIERSLGGDTAKARQAEIDRLNQSIEDRALNVPLTFAKAYMNYIGVGKPIPMWGEKILCELGVRQCQEIDDSIMLAARDKIFAPDAKPSYINRHLYTPVNAILKMALKNDAPVLTRPEGHKNATPIEIPNLDWLRIVGPHMGPVTKALVWFLTIHGRRLGDALGRRPSDFNQEDGTLSIGKSKTGDPVFIHLHPTVVEAILLMPDWDKHYWLFRDGPNSGNNVRKDILIAVIKANGWDPRQFKMKSEGRPQELDEALARKTIREKGTVRYFGTHAIGRHSAATRALLDGYSLLHIKEMFGWGTIEMVARRYGHLAKRETNAAVHKVADAFVAKIGSGAGHKRGSTSGAKFKKRVRLLGKHSKKCLPKIQ